MSTNNTATYVVMIGAGGLLAALAWEAWIRADAQTIKEQTTAGYFVVYDEKTNKVKARSKKLVDALGWAQDEADDTNQVLIVTVPDGRLMRVRPRQSRLNPRHA